MAQYPIPTDTAPTFDPNAFAPPIVGITRTEADILYCHYPDIQGDIHVPAITVAGTLLAENVAGVDYVMCSNIVCSSVAQVGTLKYQLLDPPIPPGAAGTLNAVLTQGNNAGGLNMTNVGTIGATAVEASIYTTQLEINPFNIALEGIVITAPSSTEINIPSDITSTGNISSVNTYAQYSLAVNPTPTEVEAHLFLSSNNGNRYDLSHYNPVGGVVNELRLRYEDTVQQPSVLTTLMVIDKTGDINLGLFSSPDPFVNIQGSTGLGRVYDSRFNIPRSPGIGNCSTLNYTPPNQFFPNLPAIVFALDLTTINTFSPTNTTYSVDLLISQLSVPVVISGTAGIASSILFYLGYAETQTYDATEQTGFSVVIPSNDSTPYTVNLNFFYSDISLTLGTNIAFSKLYILAQLIPSISAPNMIATMGVLNFKGIVKSYSSGVSTTITGTSS